MENNEKEENAIELSFYFFFGNLLISREKAVKARFLRKAKPLTFIRQLLSFMLIKLVDTIKFY